MNSDERTQLLRELQSTVDFTNAAEVLAARVALGTASWNERLRHHLHLGPSKAAIDLAKKRRSLNEAMARFRSELGP